MYSNKLSTELSSKILSEYYYSGYFGQITLDTNYLDTSYVIGTKHVRIKIIDAYTHNLNVSLSTSTNTVYSISYLETLESPTINKSDNSYYYFLKCFIEDKLKGETLEIPIEWTNRIQDDYPKLLLFQHSKEQYKEILHVLYSKLTVIDIFFNIYNYLLFIYESTGTISVNHLQTLIAIVNVKDMENAIWTGQYAIFGNGGLNFYPLASISVVGHELSHGLIDGIVKLEYKGHSGALNESYADIFGAMFEVYMIEKFNPIEYSSSLIKSGDLDQNVRNMEDPHQSYVPQPKIYKGLYYVYPNSSYDYGGVHINSGLINHLFYLLSCEFESIPTLYLFFECLSQMSATCTFEEFSNVLVNVSSENEKPTLVIILKQINLYNTTTNSRWCCR